MDFLFYTDQDVEIDAPNFRVTKTTLDALHERFERIARRPVSLPNAYKLCDYRIAYGLFFEEELRGYDFWGYCDIDLVFGQIRHFLTDELLASYDRFYNGGLFCLYRNNEKMRHAFELPGSAFTLDEMFAPPHIGMDEFLGINRICRKNPIAWYTKSDYAHLSANLETRLEIRRDHPNYPAQVFYWLDGHAYRRYVDGEQVNDEEFLCIHWYKRRPVPERIPRPGEAVVITTEKLLVCSPQDLTSENMLRWNPPVSHSKHLGQFLKRQAGRFAPLFQGNTSFQVFRAGFQ